MLPDSAVLPDVLKISVLARGGRGIIGSDEKTTWSTAGKPRSPVPEVAGLHAESRCSNHTGLPDLDCSHHTEPGIRLVLMILLFI